MKKNERKKAQHSNHNNKHAEIEETISKENKEQKTKLNSKIAPPIKVDKKDKYISFSTRVCIYSIICLISILLAIFCITKSLVIDKEEYVTYQEKSDIDYKVNLKSNDFYESPYLGKDMIYIASLINGIDINFLYDFTITEPANITFNYDVVARLEIVDPVDKQVYYEKEYTLLENQQATIDQKQQYYINQPISIDYNYYNSLANSFKSTYGVDSESNLVVYLKINKNNTNDTDLIKISNQSNMSLTIPLSEKAINIQMDYKEINASKTLVKEENVKIENVIFVIFSIIFLLVAIQMLHKLIKILPIFHKKLSLYDNYIKKILTEYDRLIVESSYCPEFEKYNIIKVKEFSELVDVHDNINQPILYYEVTKHQKSYFYIKSNDDIYLTTIKAVDLEEKNEKK